MAHQMDDQIVIVLKATATDVAEAVTNPYGHFLPAATDVADSTGVISRSRSIAVTLAC